MGELMHDALGVGLAATQLGVLHRVLVYRVEPEDPVTALINPVLEWSSEEREIGEEGCLSLPGVHVEVERPAQVRVRARDPAATGARDRGRGSAGARDPARDRPPRRRPDPRPHLARGAQGGDARDARGARITRRTAGARRLTAQPWIEEVEHRLPRHLRVRRRGARAAGGERRASPGARAHAPRPPARRGRRLTSPPVAERRARSGLPLEQPESVNDPAARVERIAQAAPRYVSSYAPSARSSGSRCCPARDAQRASLAAAALARRGADRAGDHGRRRARPASSIMRLTAGLDSGPVCLAATEPIRPERHLRHARGAPAALGGELLVRALDERPPFVEQARGGRHLRREDRPRGSPARSEPARGRAGARSCARCIRTSARALALPDGTLLGVHRAAAVAAPSPRPRGRAGAGRSAACCSSCQPARSSCSRCSPPGGRAMDAAAYLRGHGLPADRGNRPSPSRCEPPDARRPGPGHRVPGPPARRAPRPRPVG